MELRQLRYFVTVAKLTNFSEASRQLNITQSTLSHQIIQMEGSFHVLKNGYMKRTTREFLRMLCENRSYGLALMNLL